MSVLIKKVEFGQGRVGIRSEIATGVLTLALIDGPVSHDPAKIDAMFNKADHIQLKFTNPISIEKMIQHLRKLALGMSLQVDPELDWSAPTVQNQNQADKNCRPAKNKRKR